MLKARLSTMSEAHGELAKPPMATIVVPTREIKTKITSRWKSYPSNRWVHISAVQRISTLLILLSCLTPIAQASPETSDPPNNINKPPPQTTIDDPRSQVHTWITTIISVLIICSGLGYSVMISTYKKQKQAFRRQDILGLMTLMASLCWWVLTATMTSPSDGKSGSISVWVALFAISVARHRHGLRNENAYLFTSLLGGLIAMTLVAAVVMLASEDTSLTKPPSMRYFIGLLLTVGPTVATVWCWVVTFVFESVEGHSEDNPGTTTHDGTELVDRPDSSNSA